jgi:hypothetical protein
VEVFCAGRAFVLAGGPVGKPHLFFVLTDPDPKTKKVIVVMLVTAKRYTDKTVSLVVGDHPWVRHDSDVEFGTARPMPLSKLAQALRRADLHLQEDLSAPILEKIRQGLLTSSRTIHDVKEYCRPIFAK